MSISDKLSSAKSSSSAKLCKIGNLLINPELSAADKKNLESVLEALPGTAGHVPNTTLGRILREEGYDISNSAVDRHRRRDCACTRVGK